jgi:23S rRNA (adenine2503-C2)-methyltransferase
LAGNVPPIKLMSKLRLIGLTKNEILKEITSLGLPKWRGTQLHEWIYKRGATNFDSISVFSQDLKTVLSNKFSLDYGEIDERIHSNLDGTTKLLVRWSQSHPTDKSYKAECVIIPEKDRNTLCVSSQVGCSLKCSFCKTGTQKFERNLSFHEIVSQVMIARNILQEYPSNIVFMGQGEPLLNYTNVKKAIEVLKGDIGLSKRRIIVSTSGVVPIMEKAAQELNVEFAISLHATTDELRDQLVPVNKQYGIQELLMVVNAMVEYTPTKSITFEYVMLKNINDARSDAERLVSLIRDIPCSVNLIAFNPWKGTIYECSDETRIKDFSELLYSKGINAPIRWSKGKDIEAACGQLKSSNQNKKPVEI